MNKNLTITDVSKRVGMSAKTIRYYESIGLFNPLNRTENKYRTFSERDIQRFHLIRKARALGLPLNEVKKIISECIDKGCIDAKKYIAAKLPTYISTIDEQITELLLLKEELKELHSYYKNKMTWIHKTDSCCEILEIKK